jgi:hypothetical protein
VTGVDLVAGARGVVKGGYHMLVAGPKADTLTRERLLHLFSDTVLVGGGSVGEVEVRIEHAGYESWTQAGVQTRLRSGGPCPVWETQAVTARPPALHSVSPRVLPTPGMQPTGRGGPGLPPGATFFVARPR